MNFNLDDPLADLFSDNSNDNDSFFESNPSTKKIKKPTAKTRGKSGEARPVKTDVNTTIKPITSSTPRTVKQVASTEPTEDDDIYSDLGFDPKKPKSNIKGNKKNLFDDLLGPMDSMKPQAPASREESMKLPISRQSTDTTTTENSTIQRPKTATGRRSSGNSGNSPLDIFSITANPSRSRNEPKPTPTVDWLGLALDSGSKAQLQIPEKDPALTIQPEQAPPSVPSDQPENVEILKIPDVNTEESKMIITTAAPMDPTQTAFLLDTINLEAQNTLEAIQQKESHLSLAAQMKGQEIALLEMQRKQQYLLAQQESQFNGLLQKQLLRQNQLEQNLKAQHDRINAHIQLLMSQSSMSTGFQGDYSDTQNPKTPQQQQSSVEVVQLEEDVKRLELERLRLEDYVSSINKNFEKETEMIENSYRKQIKLLNDHAASVEARLQGEIESLHKFYTKKLDSMEVEKQNLKTELELSVTTIKQEHSDDIRRLKRSQEEDLESLKDDHRRMLDTIRQSKLIEFAAVQDNGSYLDTLRLASNNLETVTGGLQTLRDELQNKMDFLHKEREHRLEVREKKLEDTERRLKMMEDSAEDEKTRLMELVSSLEMQLTKLSRESSEENWILRQKMASLEADKAAFEKEKNFYREQLAKDEKRIENLKEQQLAETQRYMLEIQEERSRLHTERAKIEATKNLNKTTDSEHCRQEAESTLKVAQDATRQADLERERYYKMQRQLETQKRDLIDKENTIRSREEDLQQELLAVRNTEQKTKETLQKARAAEQNFNAKIQFLQQRMRELTEKESNISQERLLLSQERINMQKLKSKLDINKCSLCRIGERSQDMSNILNSSTMRFDNTNDGIPVATERYTSTLMQPSLVDQILDDNIVESLRKMNRSTGNTAGGNSHWQAVNEEEDDFKFNSDPIRLDPEISLTNNDTFHSEFL